MNGNSRVQPEEDFGVRLPHWKESLQATLKEFVA
jgi:hypothetical protein